MSGSQSQTSHTTTSFSTMEEHNPKNPNPLTLGVYTLTFESRFQRANDVKMAFRLEGKEDAGRKSSPKATDWTFKYREGTKHSWMEQPMLTEPDVNVNNWGRFWNPLKAPSPKALQDVEVDYSSGARFNNKTNYENVFINWKSNHRRNYDHDDDYATIPYLEDWEMKCALEGNWAGLSHMLPVPRKKHPVQQSGERKFQDMRPLKDWTGEWYLAKNVFRLKQKHDEWKKAKMEGYIEAMALHEECDDVAERFEEEVEAADALVAIAGGTIVSSTDSNATLTASPTPSPAPTPKKHKRAARKADTAPIAQSNGDELRRGKRARKATVPFGSRKERLSPIGNRSTAQIKLFDPHGGFTDGTIDNLSLHNLEPSMFACSIGILNDSTCLAAAQVNTVRKIYQPLADSSGSSGKIVYPAFGLGASTSVFLVNIKVINGTTVPAMVYTLVEDHWRGAVYNSSTWKSRNFSTTDMDLAVCLHPGTINIAGGTSHNVSTYHGYGEKLLA
ncbi:hypothetical protein DPSP01_011154 [Paraphaeosphaeria sporulosa]